MKIITDSMSDIRADEAAKMGVTVVPLHVIFGMYSYLDDVTITREEFYERLEAGELPKTSQASPDSFDKAFRTVLKAGEEVLCITGSSKVSGTWQSASIARDLQSQPERVHLVDSLSGNVGEALLVQEAVRLRADGMDAAEVAKALEALIPRLRLSAQVESLKHLALGGRISGGAAKVGDLLYMKPLLSIVDGKVAQQGMARGHKKAYGWFLEQITQSIDPAYPVYLASCNAPAAMEKLRIALVAGGVPENAIREMGVGSVIGTHTGPGCLTLAWVEKEA
ncbi:MAG: DegV family protein [Eubacteriales bacterium]|nr:DegV family protein [Eubacteriales bacterium]